jgi:hypothetical protein
MGTWIDLAWASFRPLHLSVPLEMQPTTVLYYQIVQGQNQQHIHLHMMWIDSIQGNL